MRSYGEFATEIEIQSRSFSASAKPGARGDHLVAIKEEKKIKEKLKQNECAQFFEVALSRHSIVDIIPRVPFGPLSLSLSLTIPPRSLDVPRPDAVGSFLFSQELYTSQK